jgi:23S rRNA pseudouridine1911/1915/1917 synthase
MIERLEVLFEDAHLLAVVKPAGLLMQGIKKGEPTLEDLARKHVAPASPERVFLGTVHRLDRPVSGVALWAKTPKAARRLSAAFAARQNLKEYWAVVECTEHPAARDGVWEDWLVPSTDDSGRVRPLSPDHPAARHAVTRFRVESAGTPAGSAWLRLWPETGRTHQLRVQAALRGLPIWGDSRYGGLQPFPKGIALHARAVSVPHPVLRTQVDFLAPLPEAWSAQGIVCLDESDRP